MTDATRGDPVEAGSPPRRRPLVRRLALTVVGLGMAAIGFLDGLVLMLKRHESTCPDGTFFPEDTKDFRCFTHPALGEGLAICAISVALGVVIALLSTESELRAPSDA